MRTGFNTETKVGGVLYHVQTEDKGASNPVIETLIYIGGQILDSIRTPYEVGIPSEEVDSIMDKQHRGTLQRIKKGEYASSVSTSKGKPDTQSMAPQRGLDDMIVDYLAVESQKDHLELDMGGSADFVYGREASVEIHARNDRTREPLAGVAVSVKIFSTAAPPATLFEGVTGPDGHLVAKFNIPAIDNGNAAIVVKGACPLGSDELKQLVKRVTPSGRFERPA